MSREREVSVTISGVSDSNLYDGRIKCNYLYVYQSDKNITGKTSYQKLLGDGKDDFNLKSEYPILLNYENDSDAEPNEKVTPEYAGPYFRRSRYDNFSFYRREYKEYRRPIEYEIAPEGYKRVKYETHIYTGRWEPVSVDFSQECFRDFNVVSGCSYQYIAYPKEKNLYYSGSQQFANSTPDSESQYGKPVQVYWSDWSIAELVPVSVKKDIPLIQKAYRVNLDNIWLFKYNLEVGNQTQNITRNEIKTLGQYSKVSQGKNNSISGSVNCLLGSEIIPYSKHGYIERRNCDIKKPLTSNEKIMMLKQWRKFVFSRNPKLLRDAKGQAWIVQIFSNENTPRINIYGQPDTISFSWKEINSIENTIIFGEGYDVPKKNDATSLWE